MLVQIDATPHAWFENCGPKINLHGAIDDDTSRILALVLRPTEDIRGYQEPFRSIILTYGVP